MVPPRGWQPNRESQSPSVQLTPKPPQHSTYVLTLYKCTYCVHLFVLLTYVNSSYICTYFIHMYVLCTVHMYIRTYVCTLYICTYLVHMCVLCTYVHTLSICTVHTSYICTYFVHTYILRTCVQCTYEHTSYICTYFDHSCVLTAHILRISISHIFLLFHYCISGLVDFLVFCLLAFSGQVRMKN